jgi:hypothetical protein
MEEYEKKLSELLSDTEFEKLELDLKSPNIFSALSISRMEIRHSNFLAWLLEPGGSHGIGDLLLRKFLREIFMTNNEKTEYSYFDVDLFDLRNVEVRREWKKVDLLIIHDDFVVAIENKVGSTDHSNQLSRYKKAVDAAFPDKKRIYVYMTLFGDDPNEELAREDYINYAYSSLCLSIEQIIEVHKESINGKVLSYLKDYITIIRRETMENDKLSTAAGKIYAAHKEALDFIFENIPGIYSELYPLFEARAKDAGWIVLSQAKGHLRFLTPGLDAVIPRGKSDTYTDKVSFLFEINFKWDTKNVLFKTIIAPHLPGYEALSEILSKALDAVEGHKKPRGDKFILHFIEKYPFNIDDVYKMDEEERNAAIGKFWPKIEEIVKKVEPAILKSKDALQQYI